MTQYDQNLHDGRIPVIASVQRGSLELWKNSCAPVFDLTPIQTDTPITDYRVSSWFVEPLTFNRSTYQSMVNIHDRWHVEEAGNQMFVHRYRRGYSTLEVMGDAIDCTTGSVTLLDYSRPFRSIHATSLCEGVFIPHHALGFDPGTGPVIQHYGPTTLYARLLSQELDLFFARFAQGERYIDPSDVHRLLGCVSAALSPGTASQSARAQAQISLKHMIKRFIEKNLADPELAVGKILANFGISRASLYRLFEIDDGVRNYITRRRLQSAVMQIAEHPHRRGQISEAARRWGFASDVTFNRAVRRLYGVSPGSLFGMPLQRVENPVAPSLVHELMVRAAQPVASERNK